MITVVSVEQGRKGAESCLTSQGDTEVNYETITESKTRALRVT